MLWNLWIIHEAKGRFFISLLKISAGDHALALLSYRRQEMQALQENSPLAVGLHLCGGLYFTQTYIPYFTWIFTESTLAACKTWWQTLQLSGGFDLCDGYHNVAIYVWINWNATVIKILEGKRSHHNLCGQMLCYATLRSSLWPKIVTAIVASNKSSLFDLVVAATTAIS